MLSRFHLVNGKFKSACFIEKTLTVWKPQAQIFGGLHIVYQNFKRFWILKRFENPPTKKESLLSFMFMMYEEEFRLERWLKTCRIESLFSTYNQLNLLYIIYIQMIEFAETMRRNSVEKCDRRLTKGTYPLRTEL